MKNIVRDEHWFTVQSVKEMYEKKKVQWDIVPWMRYYNTWIDVNVTWSNYCWGKCHCTLFFRLKSRDEKMLCESCLHTQNFRPSLKFSEQVRFFTSVKILYCLTTQSHCLWIIDKNMIEKTVAASAAHLSAALRVVRWDREMMFISIIFYSGQKAFLNKI